MNTSKKPVCRNKNGKNCCMAVSMNGSYECVSLSNTEFKNNKCPFHKTNRQVEEQMRSIQKRFATDSI